MPKTKFKDIVVDTSKRMTLDEGLVNQVARFHYNKAMELFESLEYHTIYIENFCTLLITENKANKYIKKIEVKRDSAQLAGRDSVTYYNGIIDKVTKLKQKAIDWKDRKREFKKAKYAKLAEANK